MSLSHLAATFVILAGLALRLNNPGQIRFGLDEAEVTFSSSADSEAMQ